MSNTDSGLSGGNTDTLTSLSELMKRADDMASSEDRVLSTEIPKNVVSFTAGLAKTFEDTARYHEQDADDLERIAQTFRDRANVLRSAAPTIKHEIDKFVAYERQGRAMSDTLHDILVKGKHRVSN